jgi:hypothetical protein
MKLSVAPGRSEIEQSAADVVAFPLFLAVVLLAVVLRQLFPPGPSTVVLVICAVAAVLDLIMARWFLRRSRATFVVTANDITFTPAQASGGKVSPPLVLEHAADSILRFRMRSNGFVGGQIVYVLKLRDETTGTEIPAGTFGKRKVKQACEAQGWTFS